MRDIDDDVPDVLGDSGSEVRRRHHEENEKRDDGKEGQLLDVHAGSIRSQYPGRHPSYRKSARYDRWRAVELLHTALVNEPDAAASSSLHVPCAGGIVFDAAWRILLVLRGQPPSEGTWSVPGGRCLPGESAAHACVREVAEETGLAVRVERFAGRVERAGVGGVVYDIDDFVCAVDGGKLHPGDDAIDARWVSRAQLDTFELAPLLRETLAEWGVLPR
jgi:8-oxo-dGTP diphosphatase